MLYSNDVEAPLVDGGFDATRSNFPSVKLPLVRSSQLSGYTRAKFVGNYPMMLDGLISQERFSHEIKTINDIISSNAPTSKFGKKDDRFPPPQITIATATATATATSTGTATATAIATTTAIASTTRHLRPMH
mmetsp:Transcript_102953/g.295212  ORF Transcript_102953/g.295212 Transcript_102953/m.295212 type:complete len:133 (+) Transcript_102953:105-503(+)